MTNEAAQAILAEHGMTGRLDRLYGDVWQLRGEIGTRGAAAEIAGEPDEAFVRQVAPRLRDAIAAF